MSSPQWKILFIGLGGAGQRHLRVVKERLGDRAQLFAYRVRGRPAVITPTYELDTSVNVEEKFGITPFKNLEDAIVKSPDVAFICNPSSLHLSVALPLAKAGCHLFIEKPLSDSWDGVEELVQIADEKKIAVMLGFQLRFHPCLQWIREQLDKNRIGRILSADIHVNSFLPGLHPYEDFQDTYAAQKDLGGGVILTEIHELDYAYWFFGLPRRVFAVGGNLGSYKLDVEDTAALLLECGNARGVFPVHIQMSMVQQPPSRRCQISGENGQILWNASVNEVKLYDAKSKVWETRSFPHFDRSQMFVQQVGHFLDSVQRSTRPVVDVKAGAESLKIALAAKESLETGRPVELETVACKL